MKAVDADGVKKHLQLNPNIVTKPNTTLKRVEYEKGKFRNEIVPVKGSEEIIESVSMGPMNRRLQKEFIEEIKALNKSKKSGMKEIDNKKINDLMTDTFDQLSGMRMGWGQLYGIMGKRLDMAGTKEFTKLFADKVTGALDRSYEILKNARGSLENTIEQYPISRQYMQEAKQLVSQVYKKATGGKVVTDSAGNEIVTGGKQISEADLQRTIKDIITKENIINLPENGFTIGRSEIPEFGLPGFFVGKSAADDIF